ncbi:MAG: polysaccharide biosynthesis protein [Elusimicrobiota bacterium]
MNIDLYRIKTDWHEKLIHVVDVVAIAACYITAYLIRFDGALPAGYFKIMIGALPLMVIVRMAAVAYFRLNRGIRQYASIKDLIQIIKAVSISSIVNAAAAMAFYPGHPRSVFIIDWLLLIVTLSGIRFVIRLTRPYRFKEGAKNGKKKKILIVGAGDAGEMLLREMLYHYRHSYEVIGLIDDDAGKTGKRIHEVEVMGKRTDIPDIVRDNNIEEIVIAIPKLSPGQMRDIVNYCIKSGAKYRTVPNLSAVVDGTIKVRELREVRIEDLLNRDEVVIDAEKARSYIKGKKVLITGAGGSIGSELCRQVARLHPDELILFEKSENPLFHIDMELGQSFIDLKKVPVIGDMCDRKRVAEIYKKHKPDIVFHAAAHKHVPLMESNPMEAIKNNVFGTKIMAEEAVRSGVERFIMLSTDKAVAPTSVMGVSKKIAETYVIAMAGINGTKFMVVRFGNVMGSQGSVIPTFKKQIENGGPVTVTDPEIKRYFMTIPEASGLVIEAGFMGDGGEIFVLEMGKQEKIIDIARDLIRLSGKEPGSDIKIRITGLRPGEKMHEALIGDDEKITETEHEKIFKVEPGKTSIRNIYRDFRELKRTIEEENSNSFFNKLLLMVPSYTPEPSNSKNGQLSGGGKTANRDVDILIADDEKGIKNVLSKYFDGRGFNTLLASNGREAVEIIKSNNVSIAIIDIRMPGFMNGIHVLKQIKKMGKNIEVMILTGFGTDKIRQVCRDLGASYLEKPFELAELKIFVEGACETFGSMAKENTGIVK